jgi:hypothetical protein
VVREYLATELLKDSGYSDALVEIVSGSGKETALFGFSSCVAHF